ncbi:MAG: plasmid pRiA4b ORF-3 family protein [Chloroflexi bacterium]|nr:plasmid pRiA4b ORF-3 family protein [Chloroflexota bacterium]
MARKKQTRGECVYCGKEYTRGGMIRHLRACKERAAAPEPTGRGRKWSGSIYHLVVQDAYGGDFWLQLEMPGKATLDDLDSYLRAIWLECCGHLSSFSIGNVFYTQLIEESWGWREERDMDVRVDRLFLPDAKIPYQYDFGSTTELTIRVLDIRRGKWQGDPITLMARNKLMDLQCAKCDKPAEWICVECMWGEEWWMYCQDCLRTHSCGDEMALPVVNSPRMGTCGYTGPAEPPY